MYDYLWQGVSRVNLQHDDGLMIPFKFAKFFDKIPPQIANKNKRFRRQNGITFYMKVQVERTLKKIVKLRYENGVLKVVANCFVSNKKLRDIIEENSDWIRQRKHESVEENAEVKSVERPRPRERKKLAEAKSNTEAISLRSDVFYGKKTFVMGDVKNVVSGGGAKTFLQGDSLFVNDKFFQTRESRLKAIKAYLKKIAQLHVSTEIANFGSAVSLCPIKVEFREIGESWLNCSMAAQRILCFDLRIAQLSKSMRTYLIAHGFAHFIYPIHDDKFWSFIACYLPHYKDIQKQLEQCQFLLNQ